MPVRRKASYLGLALCVLSAPAARALDKDAKKWLDEVKPIMLPDEEKTYRDLKDKGDVAEFQKIFWARRDPDLETPANEYQAEYQKARADADSRYRIAGTPGSLTDCGRVFILLGPPDDVKKAEGTTDTSVPGRRAPETWTYRDRPGFKFGPTGQIELGFDETCALPQGNRMGEQLNRLAEGRVVSPNIGYRRGADGKLRLADQLPKPSPANALLKAPRQDFPISAEPTMFLRGQDGASYVAGLVKGDASTLTLKDAGGKKSAKVVVGIQAVDETGKSAGTSEREINVDVAPDNSYVASYGMALKPGTYTMKVAVLDPQTGKGSVATLPTKLPNYDTEGLTLSPLLVLRDVADMPANPQDALAAFQLGPMRFIPRYGNVFSTDDSVTLLTFLYNPKVDAATGKPSTTASFMILKDGKPVAKAEDQNYDTPGAGPSVGPVPLAKYAPGKYVAQVKVRDNVAKKDLSEEATFEVK